MIPFIPVIIICIGAITACILNPFLGEWSFIPVALLYWGSTFLFSIRILGNQEMRKLFQKPIFKKRWVILAIIPALIPLSILLMNLKLIGANAATLFWILFALINPVFEEIFWRGLLLHKLPWKPTLNVIYSTVLFVLSHPFIWGVFSIANRSWMTWTSLVIMGTLWSIIAIKTKSIRYCIISHFFVDIFNLSVFVFLNIYIPPVM